MSTSYYFKVFKISHLVAKIIMLAQLRLQYPHSCLVSELLEIKQGKYIVRVLVQVEGIAIATSMAAAETIELAEDRARERVLAILGLGATTPVINPVAFSTPVMAAVPPVAPAVAIKPVMVEVPLPLVAAEVKGLEPKISEPKAQEVRVQELKVQEVVVQKEIAEVVSNSPALKPEPVPFPPTSSFSDISNATPEKVVPLRIVPDNQTPPEISPQPVAAVAPAPETLNFRAIEEEKEEKVVKTKPVAIAIPDIKDVMAKTEIEIRRLGWTTQQGRNFLLQRYGKRARTLLSDEELLDFLSYLEQQPMAEGN